MRRIIWIGIFCGNLLSAGICFAAEVNATHVTTIPEKARACAACHGEDGNSIVTIWPKLAGQNKKYLFKQMQDFKQGESGLRYEPSMYNMVADLTPEDMKILAQYYAGQTMSEGAADPELVKMGEKIYRGGNLKQNITACAACHSPTGVGNAQAGFPRLNGQHAEYTLSQLKAYRDGKRSNDLNGIMRDITKRMTEQEMQAVASYIAGLH